MKFQAEKKKPTLCIYTDEEYSTEKLDWEVSRLRAQLDGTRAALRLQAARCRHLVAAFSSQIQRSELAASRERELRDSQLSRLLRALLVLDAGLRREQRHIREQLRAKDSIIHAQRLEIAMLREGSLDDSDSQTFRLANMVRSENGIPSERSEGDSKSSSYRLSNISEDSYHERKEEVFDENSKTYRIANMVVSEDMFGEITTSTEPNQDQKPTTNGDSQPKSARHVKFTKNCKSSSNRKPLRESTEDHHVLRQGGLEELQRMSNGLKEEIHGITMNDDSCFEDEALNRNLYEDYQHNPVLECVNQILLRDFEDDDDKENYQRRSRVSESGSNVSIDRDDRKWPLKDKAPSPPIKAQHLEEKACLMMSSQRMTLVRTSEDVEKSPRRETTPPALPPKPKQLLLRSQDKHPQRKILSNGSLKYPLNEPNGNAKTFEEKVDELDITMLHVNTPRGIAVINRPEKTEEKQNGKIKVGSSVSFLITGAAGDSIVNELHGEPSKVSNMVKKFEHLVTTKEGEEEGNAELRENFEEFKLEDVDKTEVPPEDAVKEDAGKEARPDGDGKESYDNFLEATGLSQKSIMTPSRMFNNHRSCVKPKDVKHRSRLLKAVNTVTSVSSNGGNIVKYWTEPFL